MQPKPRTVESTAAGRHFLAPRSVLGAAAAAVFGIAAGVVLSFSSPSQAQAPIDGAEVWVMGGCAACHGNLAAGGQDAAMPQGPSLRRTRLDAAGLKETISCGRADKSMPANRDGAYTTVACYGLPLGTVPSGILLGAGFSEPEIDALVTFLTTNVVGQSKITKANCALFNGGNLEAPDCRAYP